MRLLLIGVFFAALSGCGTDSEDATAALPRAASHPPQAASYGATEQKFDGPGLVCGDAFALVLKGGERLTRRDPKIDFLTYRVEGLRGISVIYEGNHPRAEAVARQFETSRPGSEFVVVHESKPDPSFARDIADRIRVGSTQLQLCGAN